MEGYLHRWRLHNFPGKPLPVLGHPHREKAFPDVQMEAPLFQLVSIVSCHVTGHHYKEPGSVLFALSLQVFVYIGKIPLEPSLLQGEKSQLSQPFLIREVLQSFNHLSGPSLSSLHYVHTCLVVGSPELDTVLQVWPYQCSAEGKGHLP